MKPQLFDHAAVEVVDYFDQFWSAYPRRVGKPAARAAFRRACQRAELADIAHGLRLWVAYWEQEGDLRYVPHPTTWLNQDRWDDEPPPPPKSRTGQLLTRLAQRFGVPDNRQLPKGTTP